MPTQRKSKLDDMTGAQPAAATPDDDYIPHQPGGPQAVYNTEANFAPGELSIAYLSLAQALSPDVRDRKAAEGDLLVTGMAPVSSVVLVVAGHTAQRRFSENPTGPSRCYSVDAVVGIGNPGTAPKPPAEDVRGNYIHMADGSWHLRCAACPFAQWTDTGKKRPDGSTINAAPPCAEIDSFLCYDITHGLPVLWNLKSSGKQAARFLKTLATGLGFGQFAIEVTAERKINGANSWMVPKVVLANDGISPEECQAYALIAQRGVKTAGAIPAATEA